MGRNHRGLIFENRHLLLIAADKVDDLGDGRDGPGADKEQIEGFNGVEVGEDGRTKFTMEFAKGGTSK